MRLRSKDLGFIFFAKIASPIMRNINPFERRKKMKQTTITLDNVGAVTLAGEIIKQAKADYIMAMCFKDDEEIPAPDYGIHGELKTPLQPALVVRDDVEDFVRSDWFNILSMNTADPTAVLVSWLEDAKLWWTEQMLGKNRHKMMPKLRHKSFIDKRIKELTN